MEEYKNAQKVIKEMNGFIEETFKGCYNKDNKYTKKFDLIFLKNGVGDKLRGKCKYFLCGNFLGMSVECRYEDGFLLNMYVSSNADTYHYFQETESNFIDFAAKLVSQWDMIKMNATDAAIDYRKEKEKTAELLMNFKI